MNRALTLAARALLALRRRAYWNKGCVEVSLEVLDAIHAGDAEARDRACIEGGHDPLQPAVFLPAFDD